MDQNTSSLEAMILPQARSLRPGTTKITLSPGNTSQVGHSHDIFIVTLADSSKIIARVAKSHHIHSLERRGVQILKHIASSDPNCLVPKVYWHNLDDEQQRISAEGMVVLQELVSGKPLSVWNSSLPHSQQMRFLNSLAGLLVELWSIPVLGCVGQDTPDIPYSQWLQDMVDRAIKRYITGSSKWGNTRDYLVMRSMIGYYAYDYDHIAEYGIAHGDLHANNIMVNDLLELTGYVFKIAYYPLYSHSSTISSSSPLIHKTQTVSLTGIGLLKLLSQQSSNSHGLLPMCLVGITMAQVLENPSAKTETI